MEKMGFANGLAKGGKWKVRDGIQLQEWQPGVPFTEVNDSAEEQNSRETEFDFETC